MAANPQPQAAADCETARQYFDGWPGAESPGAAAEHSPTKTDARPGDLPAAARFGPYRVVRLLGRGGMGAVYLADDTQLGRQVALKIMLPGVASDSRSRERFLREARSAAAVRDDHVVTVYQVGDADGVLYIAMELLRGMTLDEYLEKRPAPGIPATLRIGREAAAALAAAHERGLVHRDVKPSNLWLEAPRGRVKVLDFGLARQAETGAEGPLTQTGAVVGTPAFMSPEQARGGPLDFRTDLFSLGGVLYQMCTGRLPFPGPCNTAVVAALVADRQPPACELNPRVPVALSKLIDRMLEKDPSARPASAREVVEALRAIERRDTPAPTAVCPVEADGPRETPPATRRRTARRSGTRASRKKTPGRPLAMVALGVLCAALLGVVTTLWLTRPGPTAASADYPVRPGDGHPGFAEAPPDGHEPPAGHPKAPPHFGPPPPFGGGPPPPGFPPPPPPGFPPPPHPRGGGPD